MRVTCRTAWVQKIKAASEEFIETEKKKREKAYQGLSTDSHNLMMMVMPAKGSGVTRPGVLVARSVKASGIGRLLVTVLEATELRAAKANGERAVPHTRFLLK